MLQIAKWLVVPSVCFGMTMLADTPEAAAQGFSIQFGTPSYGYGYGGSYRSYRPSYGYGYSTRVYPQHRSYYPSHSSHHPHGLHYDYHAPSLVPHGNHLDYVPGHYDLHYGNHGHRGRR